jgi:hypothetical protein
MPITREYIDEHLREEFENKMRELKPPTTLERKLDGEYIEPMMQFLFCLFSQGAQVGAKMAVEELLLKEQFNVKIKAEELLLKELLKALLKDKQ